MSCASQDAAVANSVVEALEGQDIRCWIAPRDVTPGEFYAGVIVHAIDAAKAIFSGSLLPLRFGWVIALPCFVGLMRFRDNLCWKTTGERRGSGEICGDRRDGLNRVQPPDLTPSPRARYSPTGASG